MGTRKLREATLALWAEPEEGTARPAVEICRVTFSPFVQNEHAVLRSLRHMCMCMAHEGKWPSHTSPVVQNVEEQKAWCLTPTKDNWVTYEFRKIVAGRVAKKKSKAKSLKRSKRK